MLKLIKFAGNLHIQRNRNGTRFLLGFIRETLVGISWVNFWREFMKIYIDKKVEIYVTFATSLAKFSSNFYQLGRILVFD